MKPTAKRGIGALLALILLPLLLIMLVDQKKTVETQDVSATEASEAVAFDVDYKEMPTTTEAPTTTTVPPTTTTEYISPTTTTAPPAPPREADSSGVNWDAIAECESGGDWHINTGNGYYGGLQFLHSTWISYGGGRYSNNAHETSRENQIAIASTMSLSHWPVCGKYG